jgi:hypothetical protein
MNHGFGPRASFAAVIAMLAVKGLSACGGSGRPATAMDGGQGAASADGSGAIGNTTGSSGTGGSGSSASGGNGTGSSSGLEAASDAGATDAPSDGESVPASVVVYPAPAGVAVSPDYTIQVEGKPVFVYLTPVNDNHFDYNAAGQTMASLAYFDMTGTVHVTVTASAAFTGVDIRPKHLGLTPTIQGKTISFDLPHPAKFTIELLGTAKPVDALHLFASAPEVNPPKSGDPNVTYFGPGIHELSQGQALTSGQTAYIAGGAIVVGALYANGSNIQITGRGIIAGSHAPITGKVDPALVHLNSNNQIAYQPQGQIIKLDGCSTCVVDGIIALDSGWTIVPHESNGVVIKDVKIINGGWASDGIDVMQSQNVTIQDVFLRTWDDSVTMKALAGWSSGPDAPVSHVRVSQTVHWNDWGGTLVFGGETQCATMTDVVWSDIDVIHQFVHGSVAMHDYNQAAISNVTFQDIRVDELAANPYVPGFLFVTVDGDHTGSYSNILFQNITANAPGMTNDSFLTGYDATHNVDTVTFDNVVVNGTHWVDAASARLHVGPYVTNVVYK